MAQETNEDVSNDSLIGLPLHTVITRHAYPDERPKVKEVESDRAIGEQEDLPTVEEDTEIDEEEEELPFLPFSEETNSITAPDIEIDSDR
jgi:hypothetical protein